MTAGSGTEERGTSGRGRLGVCSWSLEPSDPADLARKLERCGARGVQVALAPLTRGAWRFEETVVCLARRGVEVLSCMWSAAGEDYSSLAAIRRTGGLRPDATWPRNLEDARRAATTARRFSCDLVTFHAGFLPERRDDPVRATMVDRLRRIVDVFAAEGIRVALETGQETASCLLGVLEELERPDVGVNFDPANLLIYGTGDPIEALKRLVPLVFQVHVKDGRRPTRSGAFGEEPPVGDGEVDWDAFLDVVNRELPDVDLVVEREAGDDRVGDVARALAFLSARRGR